MPFSTITWSINCLEYINKNPAVFSLRISSFYSYFLTFKNQGIICILGISNFASNHIYDSLFSWAKSARNAQSIKLNYWDHRNSREDFQLVQHSSVFPFEDYLAIWSILSFSLNQLWIFSAPTNILIIIIFEACFCA